jgi:hypothetical protein
MLLNNMGPSFVSQPDGYPVSGNDPIDHITAFSPLPHTDTKSLYFYWFNWLNWFD